MRARVLRVRHCISSVLLSLFIFPVPSGAVPGGADDHVVIQGIIRDERGAPVAYANIVLVGTHWGAYSQGDGRYVIRGLPAGTYTLSVTHQAFEPQTAESITLNPGGDAIRDFRLRDAASLLPEVEVIGKVASSPIKSHESSTSHQLTGGALRDLPVSGIIEAIGLRSRPSRAGTEPKALRRPTASINGHSDHLRT